MSCPYRSGYGFPLRGCQPPVWPGNEFFLEGFNMTKDSCNVFKHPGNCGPGGMPCCFSNVLGTQCDNPLKVGGSQADTFCTYSYPKGFFMRPEDKKKFSWGW